MRLNVAHTLARSRVNGPGERFVLWVQGCHLACPGCWNRDTWSFQPRHLRTIDAMAEEILAVDGIEGVTFTGGEPFAQARPLAALAAILRARGLGVVVFTGHELEELSAAPARALLAATDLLVSGRFVQAKRTLTASLRGSTNQTLHHLTPRYCQQLVDHESGFEIHLDPAGGMAVTGFPPQAFRPPSHGTAQE